MPEDRIAPTHSASGPLFIVGAPRSGTTLVYKLVCLHPETAWISNWVRRFPALPQLAALNLVPSLLPHARYRAWFGEDSNAYVYGTRRPLHERLLPAPVEGEPVFRRAGLGEEEIDDPSQVPGGTVAELRRAVEAVGRFAGRRYFVSKRVANNRRIPLLAEAFPTARFLEIVRDGRAVAQSLSTVDWWRDSRVWWNGVTPAEWEADGGDPWELCARAWTEELQVTRRGLAAVAASRVLRLRYEDLVADPQERLEEVRKFAQLSESDAWLRAVSLCDVQGYRAIRRDRLPEEALATIEAIQGDLLRLHGYAADKGPQAVRSHPVEAPQAL